MRIAIKTLGCKSNRYESDHVFEMLRKRHEVFEMNEGSGTFQQRTSGSKVDLLIVNTCTVTHVADRKSRQAIRSFKHLNPNCKVIAFGCGVNVSAKSYEQMTEVDYLAKDARGVVEFAGKIVNKNFESCEYGGNPEDISVGFPGETDKEFEKTYNFVKTIGFLKVHVFPYSKRAKMVVSYMKGQISERVKKERAEKMRKLSSELSRKFIESCLGKEYEVLIENFENGLAHGFTSNYIPVQILCTCGGVVENQVAKVKLLRLQDDGEVEAKLV